MIVIFHCYQPRPYRPPSFKRRWTQLPRRDESTSWFPIATHKISIVFNRGINQKQTLLQYSFCSSEFIISEKKSPRKVNFGGFALGLSMLDLKRTNTKELIVSSINSFWRRTNLYQHLHIQEQRNTSLLQKK